MNIDEESENQKLKFEIENLNNGIDSFWLSLNGEGVWLFISTLGCWSVDVNGLKIFALLLTAGLFGHRISQKNKGKDSFVKLVNQIEKNINIKLRTEDTAKARMFDLNEVKTKKLSKFNILKRNAVFIFCYIFWALSFIYVFK